MICELRLTGFQGFDSRTKIRLAPLTLIFGPNSSGKSSVIRSLLLLKQSLRSGAADDGRMTFVDADVDLGGFANVIHKHDVERHLSIGVTLDRGSRSNMGATTFDFSVRSGDTVSEFALGSELFSIGDNRSRDFLGNFSLRFLEDADNLDAFNLAESDIVGAENLLSALSAHANFTASRLRGSKGLSDEDVEELTNLAQPGDLSEVLSTLEYARRGLFPSVQGARKILARHNLEFPEDLARRNLLRAIDEFISQPSRLLESQFRKMTHLGGLRAIPDRVTNVGTTENKLTSDASNIVAILGSNRKIAEKASQLISRLTRDAYELELIKLNDRSIEFLGDVGSLVLRDMRLKTTTTFKDVGVGLSQVLPIITVLAQASQPTKSIDGPRVITTAISNASQTVLLEQPELHLHPRMQAELADVILEASAAKINGGPQVIMETHSESFILRLQRRMREGKIRPDDLAILFVDRDEQTGASKVTELEMDSNGEFLTAWPESFGLIRLDEILP